MDRVPYPVLGQIMLFLDPESVLLCFMSLNRSSYKVVHSEVYLSNYLESYFNQSFEVPAETAFQILRSLGLNGKQKTLKFFGFGTTGGLERNSINYWVDNIYNGKNRQCYPSYGFKFNINTVGVLSNTQYKSKMLNLIRKYSKLRPDIDNMLMYARQNRGVAQRVLQKIQADISQRYNRNEDIHKVPEALKEPLEWALRDPLEFDRLKRRLNDNLTLIDPIDIERSDSGDIFFLSNEVYISRPMNYTRPVYAFMVLVSSTYVDIENQIFHNFDDLRTEEEFECFLNTEFGKQFSVSENRMLRGVVYRTFKPSKGELQPMVWGKFDCKIEGISIKLDHYFKGVYLYAKLICPNLKFSINGSNIDTKRVKLKGFEIQI